MPKLKTFKGILHIRARLEWDAGDIPGRWTGYSRITLYVKNPTPGEASGGEAIGS